MTHWTLRAPQVLLFVLAFLSIASLLAYFVGIASFRGLAITFLAVETIGLISMAVVAHAKGLMEPISWLVSGLWTGALATLAYDLVRIPVAHSGIPVFKAVSYFGTLLLGVQSSTPVSEVLGWAYHLSNGVSFGLMYVALFRTTKIYTAVIWGLTLEAVMLLTPYAEVFGYRRDAKFFAITFGAHAVYGAVLYLALRLWNGIGSFQLRPAHVAAGVICVVLGLSLIAADSYRSYARNPDAKLNALARMTYLNEVTPWMLASDPEVGQLTQRLRLAAEKECGQSMNSDCVERLFQELDHFYQER